MKAEEESVSGGGFLETTSAAMGDFDKQSSLIMPLLVYSDDGASNHVDRSLR